MVTGQIEKHKKELHKTHWDKKSSQKTSPLVCKGHYCWLTNVFSRELSDSRLLLACMFVQWFISSSVLQSCVTHQSRLLFAIQDTFLFLPVCSSYMYIPLYASLCIWSVQLYHRAVVILILFSPWGRLLLCIVNLRIHCQKHHIQVAGFSSHKVNKQRVGRGADWGPALVPAVFVFDTILTLRVLAILVDSATSSCHQ